MSARIGRNNVLKNLVSIYKELEPSNFGFMTYLTMVSKMSDYCDTQTVRKAVEITVVDLKRFDLTKYASKDLPNMNTFCDWLFETIVISVYDSFFRNYISIVLLSLLANHSACSYR